MRFVRFSHNKTVNCTAPYSAMHCYLWCGAVMPFCERFCCFANNFGAGGLCGYALFFFYNRILSFKPLDPFIKLLEKQNEV